MEINYSHGTVCARRAYSEMPLRREKAVLDINDNFGSHELLLVSERNYDRQFDGRFDSGLQINSNFEVIKTIE